MSYEAHISTRFSLNDKTMPGTLFFNYCMNEHEQFRTA